MRYLSLVIFLLISNAILSQINALNNSSGSGLSSFPEKGIVCYSIPPPEIKPLFVVDGIPHDSLDLKKMNPADIEKVEILRSSIGSALYGSRGSHGVILLTTTNASMRQFVVKDSLDANGLPGATLTFVSLEDEKGCHRFAADSKGLVQTNILKAGERYKVIVSSVGFKTVSTELEVSASKELKTFLVQRDIQESAAVAVLGYTIRCRAGIRRSVRRAKPAKSATNPKPVSDETYSSHIYPNPTVRGGAVKIELNTQDEKPLQLRITNLSGAALISRSYRPSKGANRMELPTAAQWAAGMYFVQVLDEKGKLLKQDKLLIQ